MLLRKMMRDIGNKKSQFISILIMAFLGIGIYAGINSEWVGLQKITDKYYEDYNLADIWLFGESLTETELTEALAIPGVTDAELRLSFAATVDLPHSPLLDLHLLDETKISRFRLVEGVEYGKELDGIWLDRDFAIANSLTVGDEVKLTRGGLSISKKVLGLITAPEYVYTPSDGETFMPNHRMKGFAYAPMSILPSGFPIVYTDLLITTDDANGTMTIVEERLSGRYRLMLTHENHPSVSLWKNELNQHKAMGRVFPLAFLAVAFLTIMTTMTRLVAGQRTEIGVLKALGFRRKKILYHYMFYSFFLSLLGAVLGLIVFPLVLPEIFFNVNREIFVLPEWKAAVSYEMFVMAGMTVLLCTLVSYMSVRGELKCVPAEALRPKAPKKIRRTIFEKTRIWRKLGFNAQWNTRDIFRNRIRSTMAIVGVAGCVMLLVCATGLRDTIGNWIEWQYERIYLFDTKLILDENISNEMTEKVISYTNGVSIIEKDIELRVNDTRRSGLLTVIDNAEMFRVVDERDNDITLTQDGVILSRKMSEILDVHVGDELRFRVYGDADWKTAKVTELFYSPSWQGIMMSPSLFEGLGLNGNPTAILSGENISSLPEGVKTIVPKSTLKASNEDFIEIINVVIVILLLAAIILAIAVLYNLGILTYTERSRELATLKVIGFRTKRVRSLLLSQNIMLTTIGVLIGIPLGHWLIGFILDTLSDNVDMNTKVYLMSIVLSVLGTYAVSIGVCTVLSRKVKTLDMISALKSVE